jgi:hypothetical protein
MAVAGIRGHFPQALANQIKKYYGNITAENTIQGIVPIVQTGDVHAVVYDLTDQVRDGVVSGQIGVRE